MRSSKSALAILTLSALVLAACSPTSPALGTTLNLAPVSVPASSSAVSAPVSVDPALANFQSTLENIYQQVGPSVVNIQVVEQGIAPAAGSSLPGLPFRFGAPASPAPQQALGSGFVWDSQGHIVTNYHVVDSSTRISVTFADGTTADAKVVGKDPNSDLAVIQVNVASDLLHPVQLGDFDSGQGRPAGHRHR